jgi:hypothetical protein
MFCLVANLIFIVVTIYKACQLLSIEIFKKSEFILPSSDIRKGLMLSMLLNNDEFERNPRKDILQKISFNQNLILKDGIYF